MPKLSVHLVAWNGAKYIPYLFESLRAQTCKGWELLAIDNGSKDATADLIERELQNFPVAARLMRNEKNLGFAGGHNQAVRQVLGVRGQVSDYFQLLNQDMYLEPDYFEKVVAMMDAHPEAGAGQGVLLRWDFAKAANSKSQMASSVEGLSDVIDTMGLRVMRNRRVVDWRTGERIPSPGLRPPSPLGRGEGEGGAVEVFGVSGALPIYRRKAIEDVMFEGQTRQNFASQNLGGQVFDEDLFSYKEDVDLAFRLRAAGWKAYVATAARAWHDRSAAGPREMSDRAARENRRTKSAFINYHSYKNHLMVLLKNEHRANFVKDWPVVCWYEFKKFIYLLFTDWRTLKGLHEVCKLWKRTAAKRKHIMANYKVRPEEMRHWFLRNDN